jgi:tartrate dehydratase alpha subunit/fumarate hydratase class I-like protein
MSRNATKKMLQRKQNHRSPLRRKNLLGVTVAQFHAEIAED